MHNNVNARGDGRHHERRVDVAASEERQGAQFRQRVARAIRVDRAHAGKPAVERDEQVEGLRFAHFADHEAVGAHPQRFLDESAQGDLAGALEARLPALHRHDILCGEVEFEGLLDRDDAFGGTRDREQRVEQRRLAALGRARDEDVLAAEHAHPQELGRLMGDGPEVDELLQVADALGELADVDSPVLLRDVGDDDVQSRAVREARVDKRAAQIDAAAG